MLASLKEFPRTDVVVLKLMSHKRRFGEKKVVVD